MQGFHTIYSHVRCQVENDAFAFLSTLCFPPEYLKFGPHFLGCLIWGLSYL